MFCEFLIWWIGRLTDLLPARWDRFEVMHGGALPTGQLSGEVEGIGVTVRRRGGTCLLAARVTRFEAIRAEPLMIAAEIAP